MSRCNPGSGNCFGDGQLIVAAPCEGGAASWLRFVMTHEYSHPHRAFGRHRAAYEAGARVVRAYLLRHGASIAEAHRLPSDELYWGSGYPLLR